MTGATPKPFYIVGRNVSAGLMSALLAEKLSSRLFWLQTEKDRVLQQDPRLGHHWVLIKRDPQSAVQNQLLRTRHGYMLHDISFFLANNYKAVLSDLISDNKKVENPVHPAILARIQAVALFNDFTPYLWERGVMGRQIPDVQWISKSPLSSGIAKQATYAIFNREELLKAFAVASKELGARLELAERAALGVQHLGKEDGNRIIFNPPNEPHTVSQILWMSHGESLLQEHSSQRIDMKEALQGVHPLQEKIGRWTSFETRVAMHYVAALPLLSIWIDQGERGRGLLASGRLSSGSIRRLFVLPEIDDTSKLPIARLILQELEMNESFDESFKTHDNYIRDAFLWHINPGLKSQNLSWAQLPAIDEEILYLDPLSEWHEVAKGCWVMPAKPSLEARKTEMRVLAEWNSNKEAI